VHEELKVPGLLQKSLLQALLSLQSALDEHTICAQVQSDLHFQPLLHLASLGDCPQPVDAEQVASQQLEGVQVVLTALHVHDPHTSSPTIELHWLVHVTG